MNNRDKIITGMSRVVFLLEKVIVHHFGADVNLPKNPVIANLKDLFDWYDTIVDMDKVEENNFQILSEIYDALYNLKSCTAVVYNDAIKTMEDSLDIVWGHLDDKTEIKLVYKLNVYTVFLGIRIHVDNLNIPSNIRDEVFDKYSYVIFGNEFNFNEFSEFITHHLYKLNKVLNQFQ